MNEQKKGLFGTDSGYVTNNYIKCDWCHSDHNIQLKHLSENTIPDSGDWIYYDYFGNFLICECCFSEIENRIKDNMKYIIPWYKDFLTYNKNKIKEYEILMNPPKIKLPWYKRILRIKKNIGNIWKI